MPCHPSVTHSNRYIAPLNADQIFPDRMRIFGDRLAMPVPDPLLDLTFSCLGQIQS
jgi:hypothetical protein